MHAGPQVPGGLPTCAHLQQLAHPQSAQQLYSGATAAVLVYTHTHTGTLSSAYKPLRAGEASQPCFHPSQLVGALVGR